MPYSEEVQKLGLGAEVTLYQLDLTALGGPIEYFVPMAPDGSGLGSISFGGQVYTPFPIIAEGFSWASGQAPPNPTLSVSNIDHALTGYILLYDSLLGAKLLRIRTFERFLDGGLEPDGTAHMPIDVFRLDRKVVHNETMVSWELASWIDQQGVQLPKRIVVRDYCDLVYRRWNAATSSFDYSKATCPYVGTAYFDRNNVATTASADFCSHNLGGCRARFVNANLPFGGFPGVAKFRT